MAFFGMATAYQLFGPPARPDAYQVPGDICARLDYSAIGEVVERSETEQNTGKISTTTCRATLAGRSSTQFRVVTTIESYAAKNDASSAHLADLFVGLSSGRGDSGMLESIAESASYARNKGGFPYATKAHDSNLLIRTTFSDSDAAGRSGPWADATDLLDDTIVALRKASPAH